jgi:hypothetical protein
MTKYIEAVLFDAVEKALRTKGRIPDRTAACRDPRQTFRSQSRAGLFFTARSGDNVVPPFGERGRKPHAGERRRPCEQNPHRHDSPRHNHILLHVRAKASPVHRKTPKIHDVP